MEDKRVVTFVAPAAAVLVVAGVLLSGTVAFDACAQVVSPSRPEEPLQPRLLLPLILAPPAVVPPPETLQGGLPAEELSPSETPAPPGVSQHGGGGTSGAKGTGRSGGSKAAGGGSKAGGGGGSKVLRRGFDVPPAGEQRFVSNEVIVDTAASIEAIAGRHALLCLEAILINLTRHTLHRCQTDRPVRDVIRGLSRERQVEGAGPNYLYAMEQEGVDTGAMDYASQKLKLAEAHAHATGNKVLVALLDAQVDTTHPALTGFIVDSVNEVGGEAAPHPHGTAVAGLIARVAPGAKLLAVRVFGQRSGGFLASTFNLIKGVDWAAMHGARVINMSFAGPLDPMLRAVSLKAIEKGIILVAAAGNAGPKSPPLYPAADRSVIAVTATDFNDRIFPMANRGDYIAVAAPGVDVLAPAPDRSYQLITGTSMSAAVVSGLVALLIEHNPALTQPLVSKLLMETARDLGKPGRDREYGAGIVDALRAVISAKAMH